MTKVTKPKTDVLVQEEKTNSEKILDFVNGFLFRENSQ